MKVWASCVVFFFAVAELYQWIEQSALPMPVYGVAGLILAMLSNSKRWRHWLQPMSLNSLEDNDGSISSAATEQNAHYNSD